MRLIFFGTSEFACPTLEALLKSHHRVCALVTQPDRPSGRSLQITPPPTKAIAQAQTVPLFQPVSVEEARFLGEMGKLKAECAVVVAYGMLLTQELLRFFPKGAFNLHPSLLPKYRGAAPIPWTLLQGETETGVTFFLIDEKLDHGPILLQARHPIRPEDDAVSLSASLAELGGELALQGLGLLETGKAKLTPQEHSKATSAPRLRKEEGVLRWQENCLAIHNKVRAFQPWPGALTAWNGTPLKLIRTHPDLSRSSQHHPGFVVSANDLEGFWVQTGQGQLRVDRCQPAGGRVMTAKEFLHGHPVQVGDLLG